MLSTVHEICGWKIPYAKLKKEHQPTECIYIWRVKTLFVGQSSTFISKYGSVHARLSCTVLNIRTRPGLEAKNFRDHFGFYCRWARNRIEWRQKPSEMLLLTARASFEAVAIDVLEKLNPPSWEYEYSLVPPDWLIKLKKRYPYISRGCRESLSQALDGNLLTISRLTWATAKDASQRTFFKTFVKVWTHTTRTPRRTTFKKMVKGNDLTEPSSLRQEPSW